MKKPLIAIPMGDPAGIGPEIVAKAAASPETAAAADCLIIGDGTVMEKAIHITGTELTVHKVRMPAEGDTREDLAGRCDFREGVLNLIDLSNIDQSRFAYGQVDGMCGRSAYEYIKKSVDLALARQADAVATPPINKEALRAGGIPYIGHTEIFGALTGTEDPLTMFQTGSLRVFFLTRHVSMRQMLDMITKERIIDYVHRCRAALEKLGITGGIMAVAALNPHGGEHGLFGGEEMKEIAPAVAELQSEGYDVAGPIPADSVFHQAAQGKYNSVLSLYHDQGHIATKTLDFERTIAITNGMPILRTSVDHGTAFDIAGTGKASAVSMIEAIRLAAEYAPYFAN